ncbi:MAG: type III PLP-dependent enzyme [Patescibacteria group bacterium]
MHHLLRNVVEREEGRAARFATPFLVIDDARVRANAERLRAAFRDQAEIFFAVKANNHPAVLRTLRDMDCGFDVASAREIGQLVALGVPGARMVFSNPVKVPDHIDFAYAHGVRLFACDTEEEIEKIARRAPDSEVYIRIAVDNTGSAWPLAGKYGVEEEEALALMDSAAAKGLVPVGLTFHVGSQCENMDNWRAALRQCAPIWEAASKRGHRMRLLDLGGGLPAPYAEEPYPLEKLGDEVRALVEAHFPGAPRMIIEPGRFLVADAAVFVASVIGRATRRGKKLVYLDAGLFNGLMEAYEVFWYPVECLHEGRTEAEEETVTLVGPTCDSVDEIVDAIRLPRLAVGDRIAFLCAGAYTNSYEAYNGFEFPHVLTTADLAEKKEQGTIPAQPSAVSRGSNVQST